MEVKMEENKNLELEAELNEELVTELNEELVEEEVHYKEMSPIRMVVRRFFTSSNHCCIISTIFHTRVTKRYSI